MTPSLGSLTLPSVAPLVPPPLSLLALPILCPPHTPLSEGLLALLTLQRSVLRSDHSIQCARGSQVPPNLDLQRCGFAKLLAPRAGSSLLNCGLPVSPLPSKEGRFDSFDPRPRPPLVTKGTSI